MASPASYLGTRQIRLGQRKRQRTRGASIHLVRLLIWVFPLGDNMNRCSACKPEMENIQHRLGSWKSKFLSRVGRLTLIKSVLNSLPVYYMSMFKMPKAIALKIVKMRRRFFWGSANESSNQKKGCPTIKWKSIELPKELGGLGVGNMMHKYLILLLKWWWRFSESDNTLWKESVYLFMRSKG